MTFYSRKTTKIRNFDYSSCHYYFVTICTHNRKCIFGKPNQLNQIGFIAQKHLIQIPSHYDGVHLDQYVVMPNHIHMILALTGSQGNPNLNQVIGQYKSGVTREIRDIIPDMLVWQRSFHDHVIRDQCGYERIWMYIEGNPLNWNQDCFFIEESNDSAL